MLLKHLFGGGRSGCSGHRYISCSMGDGLDVLGVGSKGGGRETGD